MRLSLGLRSLVFATFAAFGLGTAWIHAAPPVIDVWYGPQQTFGAPGVAQRWANIVGNVSDPDGIDTLTYSLNDGPEQTLSVGPDTRRLYDSGDFNIDLDFADLLPGTNGLAITATDNAQETATANVTINYVAGQAWPLPVSIDWSTVTNVQDVAQVVDGLWTIENDALRAPPMAYDRVIAFGDIAWTNYEITARITQLDLDSNGFFWPSVSPGFGITMRWPGHSDDPVVCGQPHCGWLPSGAGFWYDTGHDGPLRLSSDNGLYTAQARTLDYGVPYVFKLRVQNMSGEGTFYALKVWEDGAGEPGEWDLTGHEDLDGEPSGSCILIAHHVDLVLGDVTVIPLANDPAPLISNVQVTPDAATAAIAWETNELTTGFVEYGPTTAYENGSVAAGTPDLLHDVLLTGLTTGTTYHFRITAVDMNSNATVTTDAVFDAIGDITPPVISAVSAVATPTFATVTWITDEPADTRVRYGPTPAYGDVASNGVLTTNHGIILTGLTPETTYHFQVDSRDADGNLGVGGAATFTTPANATPVLVSDHFNQATLDTTVWTWVDPLVDGASYAMTGQQFRLDIPATGAEHQLWTDGIVAPRLLQSAPDTDFEIEAKFDSPVTQDTQIQGLVIQESPIHLIRAEFHYVAGSARVFVASVFGESATVHRHLPLTLSTPMHLRVRRTDDLWRVDYSFNGVNWTLVKTFTDALTVTAVGLHGGNDFDTPHALLVDYFRDTSDPRFLADCNLNGTADGGDISAGTSLDCDTNGIPDECDLAGGDCNTNGIPDACDPDSDGNGTPDDCEFPGDCDHNGVQDIDELAGNDCDSNGVLDTCDPDCNTNGVPDACEVFTDCNSNAVPDECELADADCNLNGVPDECELAGNDCDSNGAPDECDVDCNSNGIVDACEVFADCNTNGVPDECDLPGNDCDSNGVPDDCDLDCNTNGTPDACESFSDCNSNGTPDECDLLGNDCDANGVPDECDPDCNANATPDACEIFADCNSNSIPDECELPGNDCDSNGVPDDCDLDCNSNGTPDECEIFADCNSNGAPDECDLTHNDCDSNGVPDECDPDCNANATPDACEIFADCNSNGVPDECELAGNDCDVNSVPDECDLDCNTNGIPDACEIFADCNSNGTPDECDLVDDDCDSNGVPDECDADCNTNGTPDACEIFVDCNTNGLPDECELLGNDCDSNGVPDECDVDCNTNGTPDACEGFADCNTNGVPDECELVGNDCDSNGMPDECDLDCNTNGLPDACEVFTDCNTNGVPDECDADCNTNGIPDACETFTDCNTNGVPDECDLPGNDCDSNGVPDECDLDCNTNGTPDACEVFTDCNTNGTPDECELVGNDCDSNGVPDECDPDCNLNGTPDACEVFADCNVNDLPDECELSDNDCDSNGIPDECDADCNLNGTPDACEFLADCDANSTPDVCEIAAGSAADINGDDVLDVCQVLNLTRGTGHPSIADAIAAAGHDDVLRAPAQFFWTEPDIDFGGRRISLLSDGTIVQPAGGTLIPADQSELLAAEGADILLHGTTTIGSLDDVAFTSREFVISSNGSLSIGASASAELHAPAGVRLNGVTQILPQGTLAADAATRIGGTCALLGGTIAAPEVDVVGANAALTAFGNVAANLVNHADFTVVADVQIIGDLTNHAVTTLQSGSLTVLGALINHGDIIGDLTRSATPVDSESSASNGMFVRGDWVSTRTSTLRLPTADWSLRIGGAFDCAIDDYHLFDLSTAMVEMAGESGGEQLFEMMCTDIGVDLAGLSPTAKGHFPIGTLRIGPTPTTVRLSDQRNNAKNLALPETLYVDHLVIDAGATLITSGRRIYYRTKQVSGTVDDMQNLIPLIVTPGDCDGDGEVSSSDADGFLGCLGGPGVMPPATAPAGCPCLTTFDLDADGDVDLLDFADLQILVAMP